MATIVFAMRGMHVENIESRLDRSLSICLLVSMSFGLLEVFIFI